MDRLSVVVITLNEEKKLDRCLGPVAWADEIIIVDSGSTDGTLDVAGRYTDKVFQNPWEGFAKQRTLYFILGCDPNNSMPAVQESIHTLRAIMDG